jgi:hypothetical protein
MILQRFMQQDNNIVKFCVVNQDEDVGWISYFKSRQMSYFNPAFAYFHPA